MENNKIITLAIETSCDETSVAVLENGRRVLSNIISSQIDIHRRFGGVVPEVASRKHIESISYVVKEALEEAGKTFRDIDHVGVTYGPGLVGALLVGISYAKGLAFARGIPLNGVNHIEGHIYGNFIEDRELEPPFISLIVSGGHSHLVYVKDYGVYEVLGKTRDDAAGEAFDKIARALDLGYPGGPEIDRLAEKGNPQALDFPKSYLEDGSHDFSFSGLKSAALNYINQQKMKKQPIPLEDMAASYQQAIIEVLVEKSIRCAKEKNMDKIVLAGGVAANKGLRALLKKRGEEEGIKVQYPSLTLCTDNAAMIGSVAYYQYISGERSPMSLNGVPNLKIKE
ncbi:tRNA (adenosine(37)-N6)-threonylcarbamoyltransferase complex transferase subunit TsaD [Isachenkonia alkalipeptolytica]|uniref:tRNA N6-adenosine threonylcarbamoyltransferase n=1 Tax=Isachenkonia alkalipeptolytica TaxID=2565777 RepID=A0AA43XMV3_9CLOT|nr:tRNA (adenosine(37)-N6)-threonylcarbamoyltransferase complex transferase subunit TsaD [Isachenkonia alkalipeptolytica]NBG89371.1 tRNA (adenosine(37)-N6)-threonylcarbamoyltransferase complex transferase subunit TsaD [Isachenkonia alkalipeptolytica]